MLRRPWPWIAVTAVVCALVWWLDPFGEDGEDATSEPTAAEQPVVDDFNGVEAEPNLGNSTQPGTTAQDNPFPEEEPTIQRMSEGFLRLQDQEGNPVQGRSILVAEDETLQGWMAIPGRIGIAIYSESILQEGLSTPESVGLPITEDGNKADLHFVIAEGYEPIVEAWEPLAAGEIHRTSLAPVEPIFVTVQDEAGAPIPNAEVWLRWIGETTFNEEGTTVERLQGRHYQEKVLTDDEGKALLTVCFQGEANSVFVRPGDAFASQQVVCSSGEEIVVTCQSAFTIKGRITVDGKVPDREVQVMAMLPVGDSFSYLESGRAKEEGNYSVKGVLAGFPTVLVQAMGEGLAMQLRHFPGGKAGEIVEIDFDMKPGVGGEITLLDAWGDPMAGATVQLVGEGDRRHVYQYEANEEGRCSLPVAFLVGDRYWMDVGFSGMTMRLPQAFVAGKNVSLQPENMAKISSVDIAEELLGDTSVTELVWRPLGAGIKGSAVWGHSDQLSPVLIAGRGTLSAKFSDGRTLVMPAFLEAGSQDSLTFEVETASLRFQLPAGRIATIRLYDQLGNFVFGADGLEGSVEIPCWTGDFSLEVYWDGGSQVRPGIHIPSGGLDLGNLSETQTGSVWGVARDEAGNPVGWSDLVLTSQDGYYFQEGATDVDGSYYITGLPLGSYYLFASSDQYHGGAGESRVQQFSITAVEPEISVDIVMGVAEDILVVEHEPANAGGTEIIHVTASGIQLRTASPTGKSELPAQVLPGWVGAVQAKGGQIMVSSAPAQEGPGFVNMPGFVASLRKVKVVDEYGLPRLDMILRLELAGFPPTGRLMPDGDGNLHLSMAGDGPWSLHARDGEGVSHSIPLSRAMETGVFEIPRTLPSRFLQVVDLEGNALSNAEAMDERFLQVFRADREGRIGIPLRHEWVLVDARGHLPLWVDSEQSGDVELPRAVRGIQLVFPAGGNSVSWSHAYSENSGVPTKMDVGDTEGIVTLPPVPYGELDLVLWDVKGEKMLTKSVTVDGDLTTVTMDRK